jgi:hypothetical protein
VWAARLLAWMYEELGDRRRARALHEHNLSRSRALGNKQLEGQSLGGLASVALDDGQARDAVALLKDILRIDRELGIRYQTSFDLTRLARALASAGGADVEAAKLLACADAVREEIGTAGPPYIQAIESKAIADLRARLDETTFAEACDEGRALTPDEAVALSLDVLD